MYAYTIKTNFFFSDLDVNQCSIQIEGEKVQQVISLTKVASKSSYKSCFKSGLYSLQSSFRIRSVRNFVENRPTLQYFLRIDSLNILNLCFVNKAFKCREIQRAGQLSVLYNNFPSLYWPMAWSHNLTFCPGRFVIRFAYVLLTLNWGRLLKMP